MKNFDESYEKYRTTGSSCSVINKVVKVQDKKSNGERKKEKYAVIKRNSCLSTVYCAVYLIYSFIYIYLSI